MKKRIGPFFLLIGTVAFILSACVSKSGMAETVPASTGALAAGREAAGALASAKGDAEAPSAETRTDSEGGLSEKSAYILPDASTRLYTQEELETLSLDQKKLARNEIYARHGREFKDPLLQKYFQGKSWYRGTAEPDQFNDRQLNQTERDNLELLKRLEDEGRGGRTGYPVPPYAKAFAQWDAQHPNQKISGDLYHDGMGSVNTTDHSVLIKHDKYYEVTDCQVDAQGLYDSGLFGGRKMGDIVNLDGTKYIIKLINTGADGYREIVLGSSSAADPNDAEGAMTLQECSEGFYMDGDNDVKGPWITIYKGSVYFYRDARIVTGMGEGKKMITAKEYFETPAPDSSAAQQVDPNDFIRGGGLQEGGGISLMGIPSYDQYGYFTGFTEGGRYWVG